VRKPDFRAGPKRWEKLKGHIGVQNANATAGCRDDILGHNFGQGDAVASHVKAWNELKGIKSNLHLVYGK
jgi:hypothetical protein